MTHHVYSDYKTMQVSEIWAGCYTGAVHASNGKNCQDAQITEQGLYRGIPYHIATVADGHGQEQHDMSEYGAKIAVECARDVMRDIVTRYAEGDPGSLISSGKHDFPRLVTRRWRERILEDAKVRNLDITDAAILALRYGTTLIATLYIRDILLCTQIGDGDIILSSHDYQVNHLFHAPLSMIGSETHSLSSPSAHLIWKTTALYPVDSPFLFLSSDGLSDSFNVGDETRFDEWLKRLVLSIEMHGFSQIISRLPGWLQDISFRGAGDDITFVIMRFEPGQGKNRL